MSKVDVSIPVEWEVMFGDAARSLPLALPLARSLTHSPSPPLFLSSSLHLSPSHSLPLSLSPSLPLTLSLPLSLHLTSTCWQIAPTSSTGLVDPEAGGLGRSNS